MIQPRSPEGGCAHSGFPLLTNTSVTDFNSFSFKYILFPHIQHWRWICRSTEGIILCTYTTSSQSVNTLNSRTGKIIHSLGLYYIQHTPLVYKGVFCYNSNTHCISSLSSNIWARTTHGNTALIASPRQTAAASADLQLWYNFKKNQPTTFCYVQNIAHK